LYRVLEDIEKRGNRSKDLKRMFAGTENEIKEIMSTSIRAYAHAHTNTQHRCYKKSSKVKHVHLKTIIPSQNEYLISKCRAVANFNEHKVEKGRKHQ
jgi:hypothetical protein